MKRTVEARVKLIIMKQLGAEHDDITREKYFVDDLGADSLDLVELLMAVEEEFEICIPTRDEGNLVTVGALIDYIEARMKGAI